MIMTAEQGKPLAEAKGEIAYARRRSSNGSPRRPSASTATPSRRHGADTRIVVIKQPIGVCAAITPWNFPTAMITRKVGPALAAGCTDGAQAGAARRPTRRWRWPSWPSAPACRPASSTSSPARRARSAARLTANPMVRKLTFTGSTEVGKLLMQQCAGTVKKLSLELGGNAPFIVFDDADLDAAVEGAIASKFRNTGQTCVCANRLLVQDGVYDAFAKKLAAAVAKLKVGNGLEAGVDAGAADRRRRPSRRSRSTSPTPLAKGAQAADRRQAPRARRHTSSSRPCSPTSRRTCWSRTRRPSARSRRCSASRPRPRRSHWPTTPSSASPPISTARDIGRVWRVAEALEYGMVGINTGLISTEVAPFGGVKQSGLGREGSKYGIEDYLEIKYLCMGGLDK